MIYCVVPNALEDHWLEPLRRHYADDPNVEVILERRHHERRARGSTSGGGKRVVRDRRRARVPGTFPSVTPKD